MLFRSAFIRAVISLPPETFLSSGASVKCSILFVQKYTKEEKTQWDSIKKKSLEECREKHGDTITKFNEIINYKKSKDEKTEKYTAEDKKKSKSELKDLKALIEKEGKELAREKWDYPIFMAEPESVGITSTGETGDNVSNDLKDLVEIDDLDNETIIEKGIISYFREFLVEHHISWSSKHD